MPKPPKTFVVRYARYNDDSPLLNGRQPRVVAAIHRRALATSAKKARALALEHRPVGFEVASVSEAGHLDRQPWIGPRPGNA